MTDQPSVEELYQEEHPFPAVPVQVAGPARTQELPAEHATTRCVHLSANATPAPLLQHDLRRKVAYISADYAVYVGTDANEVSSGYSAILPANVLLPWASAERVYVRPAVADQATVVSVSGFSWTG